MIRNLTNVLFFFVLSSHLSAQSGYVTTMNCSGSDLTSDFGARVMNCQALLPSTGGTIDAAGTTGAQACTTNIVLNPNVTLLLRSGTQISGPCEVSLQAHDSIEGSGGTGMYTDAGSSISWTYTGTVGPASTGNLVSIVPNAYDVKLANVQFIGNPSGAVAPDTGNGLFASPGPGFSPSNIGLTLDHVTFRFFALDGIHLEDNVYMVDCYRCAATDNNRYGWYQAPNRSIVGPNQVDVFAGRFTRNGVGQVYAMGGESAGTFSMWGGSISSELFPSGTSYCADFEAGNNQQMDVFLDKVHIESCGGTSGGGAFINFDAWNGTLTVRDSFFVIPIGTADNILIGSHAGGQAFIGPGNLLVTNPGGYALDDQSTFSSNNIEVYDPIGGGAIGNIHGNVHLLNSVYSGTAYASGEWEQYLNGARLHFYDPTSNGQNFTLEDSQGALSVNDENGNQLLQFIPDTGTITKNLQINQHLFTLDKSTDVAGSISIEDSTKGTKMFATQYNNNPVCVVTPNQTLNGHVSWWGYNVNQQGIYIFTNYPVTAIFNYICVGAPN